MSETVTYSESDMFGHTRTRHVEQFWYKQVRIQAIKLNDRNVITDRHLQNMLDDPDGVDSYLVMRNIARGICNDIVHCTIPTVEVFTKLNCYQYHKIYMDSRKWKGIAEQVRSRDGNKCTVCECTKEENFLKYNRNLDVHHIHYENTFAEDFDQLATFCGDCHQTEHEIEYPKYNLN